MFFSFSKRSTVIAVAVALASFFLLLVLSPIIVNRVQVEAGTEAVLVDKPFFTMFGDGGVRPEPQTTGPKWLF